MRNRETGKSLGFAFVTYVDDNLAASAIRNLHGYDLGHGRRLQVAYPNKSDGGNARRKAGTSGPDEVRLLLLHAAPLAFPHGCWWVTC